MAIHCANLGHGIGLRAAHFKELAERPVPCQWFEATSENYMGTRGEALAHLLKFRREVPIVLHGVALGIGNTDPLSRRYLHDLKALIGQVQPAWVSDHLAWTGVNGENSHDLLPLPRTQESLRHVCRRVARVQDSLGRQILLENPSTYAEFSGEQIPEWEFLSAVADRADCGILLDINNVYVNAYNHGFDPLTYLNGIDPLRVGQIHLAGYTECGTHLLDTHAHPVSQPVWDLYQSFSARHPEVSTLIEWDDKIPPLDSLLAQMHRAQAVQRGAWRCVSRASAIMPCPAASVHL
jgi:uncharacterized protein (UPF0276 family)